MDLYKFEIGDIHWKEGYIEHNDHFSTNSESDVFEALADNEQGSLTDDNCRTKSCQDPVTCQISNFCLDCPRMRYSI